MSATIAATSSLELWPAVTRSIENMPRNGSTNGSVIVRISDDDVVARVRDEQQQDDPQDQRGLQHAEEEGDDPRHGRRSHWARPRT